MTDSIPGSETRMDRLSGQTVIIAPQRSERPGAMPAHCWPRDEAACPFCKGQEHETPSAVLEQPHDDWQVRVVPNRYPILSWESGPSNTAADDTDTATDQVAGACEVIIETPDHTRSWTEFSDAQATRIVQAWQSRIAFWRTQSKELATPNIAGPTAQTAVLFKNQGPAAGASLMHSHSQLIITNQIPHLLQTQLDRCQQHYQAHGSSLLCDEWEREREAGKRLVAESGDFIAYCPYASRTAYEIRIVPKQHHPDFDLMESGQSEEFAQFLRQILRRLESLSDHVPYNLLVHTAPFDSVKSEHYHWHVGIIPRFMLAAGFEWSTGYLVNPVAPEQAAAKLRSIQLA